MSSDVSHPELVKILNKRSNVVEEESCIETMLRPSNLASSLSKSLYSAPTLQYLDANSFADVLGVSPAYRQKETLRWNSALHLYKQMSNQDLTKLADEHQDTINDFFDENVAPLINNVNDGMPCVGPTSNAVARSSATNVISPSDAGQKTPFNYMSLPSSRYGFLTPPVRNSSLMPEMRRSHSFVPMSPGESSLNSLELEAIAAVHELLFALKDIFVSELLPRTSELIFLNVTSLEGQAYCVELTMKGWRVTSLRHDCMNGDIKNLELHTKYFETIYALMDNISPHYRDKFSEALSSKLSQLQQQQQQLSENNNGKWPPMEYGYTPGKMSASSSFNNENLRIVEDTMGEIDFYDNGPITVNVKYPSSESRNQKSSDNFSFS